MFRPQFLTALIIAFHGLGSSGLANDAVISRLAFGACARQDRPQPIWDAVVATEPQLFVWLGDNIYGDTEDMDVLRAKYQLLIDQPGYQKLKATCPVLGTWDDHDYGVNDGGVEYPKKRESQQVFLDFLNAPAADVRRTREGVYSSNVYGPPGKRLQLLLLDARYFRSPLVRSARRVEPGEGYRGIYGTNDDPQSTMLGDAQWRWLEEQLQIPAELRIIGSGVQVIAEEHGWEMWGNFPHERKRLFEVIRRTKAQGVLFLSGDRHLAEIARLPADHPLGSGYPLFDVTSSSLNVPSGNMTKAGTRFANEINSHRVGLTYFETNFGSVHVDWEQPDPVVRMQVRDAQGAVVLQQRVSLSQLRPNETE